MRGGSIFYLRATCITSTRASGADFLSTSAVLAPWQGVSSTSALDSSTRPLLLPRLPTGVACCSAFGGINLDRLGLAATGLRQPSSAFQVVATGRTGKLHGRDLMVFCTRTIARGHQPMGVQQNRPWFGCYTSDVRRLTHAVLSEKLGLGKSMDAELSCVRHGLFWGRAGAERRTNERRRGGPQSWAGYIRRQAGAGAKGKRAAEWQGSVAGKRAEAGSSR